MTIHHAGNALVTMPRYVAGSGTAREASGVNMSNAAATAYGFSLEGASSTVAAIDCTDETELWLHFELYLGTNFITKTVASIGNADNDLVRLQPAGTGILALQYWNGSSWVSTGNTITVAAGYRYVIDMRIVMGASGSVSLYKFGSIVGSATSVDFTVTGYSVVNTCHLNHMMFSTSWATYPYLFSGVVVANESTLGFKVYNLILANKYSTYWEWNGGVNTYSNAVVNATTGAVDEGTYILSTNETDVTNLFNPNTLGPSYTMTRKAAAMNIAYNQAANGPDRMYAHEFYFSNSQISGNLLTGPSGSTQRASHVFNVQPNGTGWTADVMDFFDIGLVAAFSGATNTGQLRVYGIHAVAVLYDAASIGVDPNPVETPIGGAGRRRMIHVIS